MIECPLLTLPPELGIEPAADVHAFDRELNPGSFRLQANVLTTAKPTRALLFFFKRSKFFDVDLNQFYCGSSIC